MPNTSCETSSSACAGVLTSGTPRSRSRAAIPAERSTTVPASTTTRTPCLLRRLDKRLLALQDPPRNRDSRRVRRVHPAIAEPTRAERARLRVRSVGGVVEDAQVEGQLRHVHALAGRKPLRVPDLVARIEVGPRLHLDDRVAALVVEVEVIAILQERPSHGDRPLVVQG